MQTFKYLLVIMGLLSFLFSGCSKQPTAQSPVSLNEPVLKVAVFADGRLTVDGTASTVQALRESLRSLGEKHGVVWYYREAGQQEPPPIALEVMNAVADARVPVQLSSRPDYSDYIDENGRSITKKTKVNREWPNKSLEPTAAPLSGLARLPFRTAGSSGCGSALIR